MAFANDRVVTMHAFDLSFITFLLAFASDRRVQEKYNILDFCNKAS